MREEGGENRGSWMERMGVKCKWVEEGTRGKEEREGCRKGGGGRGKNGGVRGL